MRPWKSSKAKLDAVQAFRFGDQKHDGKYAPQPEPEDPPTHVFQQVHPGQGQASSYYGNWVPQPPMLYPPGYYTNSIPQPGHIQYPNYNVPPQSPQSPLQGLGNQQEYEYLPPRYNNQQQGYVSPLQPSMPPQGYTPFSPLNANQTAFHDNQDYTYNNYGQSPVQGSSPEAGIQSSPPTHSSPEPPQQAHTRGLQRSLTYDDSYGEQFSPPQHIETEPAQAARHDCNYYGLAILGKSNMCG